jgi:apolipoprotein N-acyltransferase
MPKERRLGNTTGLTVGYLIISAAVAILIAYYLNVWWYFFPIMMIAGGIYLLIITALTARSTAEGRSSYITYMLLWGGLIAILGAEWIVNDIYPSDAVFLVVVVLVFVGLVAIIGFLLRGKR